MVNVTIDEKYRCKEKYVAAKTVKMTAVSALVLMSGLFSENNEGNSEMINTSDPTVNTMSCHCI